LDGEHAVDGDLVEAQVEDLARIVEAIEIDVKERQPPAAVFLDQRERRAAHFVTREAKPLGQPFHERGLSGAEIAIEQHDIAGAKRLRQVPPDVGCLRFGFGRNHHHVTIVRCPTCLPYTDPMRRHHLALILLLIGLAIAAPSAQKPPASPASSLLERVDNTGFLQIEAPSFSALQPRQQQLAYWLTQASIAIDPIIYDQLSQYGLREKRLLEGIMGHPAGVAAATLAKIRRYTLLFWANRGNHNEITGEKVLPTFTAAELEAAALAAQKSGAFASAYGDLPALATAADLRCELTALRPSPFDPAVEPITTAKTPPPGKDIIQASSNTFYRGVTLNDLKGFTERFPLNSRVVKGADGVMREEVYRAGTPDGSVAPGLYAVYLKKAIEYLERARAVADPPQA